MSRADLASAALDVAKVMLAHPETQPALAGAFVLLTESLAMCERDSTQLIRVDLDGADEPRPSPNAQRIAAIWKHLRDFDPGQRIGIVHARTGWSRATYFRALSEAKELGLIE